MTMKEWNIKELHSNMFFEDTSQEMALDIPTCGLTEMMNLGYG